MIGGLTFNTHCHPEALSHIIRIAGGYPYFLQEYGSVAWNLVVGPVITPDDAVVAERFGQAKLDAGFFASRWGRTTPAERNHLRAMAYAVPGWPSSPPTKTWASDHDGRHWPAQIAELAGSELTGHGKS